MPSLNEKPPRSLADFYRSYVPEYASRNYGSIIVSLDWDRDLARKISEISGKRSDNRVMNYVIQDELDRVIHKLGAKDEASIRFGRLKPGHGYSGERGDFCLIAGVVSRKELWVYYRSLELIGGLAYDWTLFWYLERMINPVVRLNWKKVTIITKKAFIFALKGNSNEKLYPKLRRIIRW